MKLGHMLQRCNRGVVVSIVDISTCAVTDLRGEERGTQGATYKRLSVGLTDHTYIQLQQALSTEQNGADYGIQNQ